MHDVLLHFTMYNQDVIVYTAVPVMFTWCIRRLVATDLFLRRVVCHCPAVELLLIEMLLYSHWYQPPYPNNTVLCGLSVL
jgi:hypothetical protein